MTARVVLNDTRYWALVALAAIGSLAALVAAVAAWRASRACRIALGHLVSTRREVDVPRREWQERSPIPRRAADAAPGGFGTRTDPTPPAAPAATAVKGPPTAASTPPAARPAGPPAPPRRADTLDDPDRPGSTASPVERFTPIPPAAASPPEALRTEPLPRPRPRVPPGPPSEEREVHPGVFVTTPGRAPAAPPAQPEPAAAATPEQPEAGGTAVDARLERLADPDPFVRIEAIAELRANPGKIDVLVRMLYDEFPVVRRQAVRSLRTAGGPVATRALLEVASQDPSAEVRQEAVDALGAMLRDVRSSPA